MRTRSAWWRHGFLNTLEFGLTRIADSGTTAVLVWALPTTEFSKLALAQAAVMPFLFLFLSPSLSVYRDFAEWKQAGPALVAAKLRAFRLYGRGMVQLALVICLVLPWVAPSSGSSTYAERFWALAWAFGLTVGLNWAGADREYLRLDLKLRALNAINVLQKMIVFLGTLWIAFKHPSRIDWLAGIVALSMMVSAGISHFLVNRGLHEMGGTREQIRGLSGPPVIETLVDAFKSFTLWGHLSGVCLLWTQTMDLFCLGLFKLPAEITGIYATALKIANLSMALPLALANLFYVWMSRRTQAGWEEERAALKRMPLLLFSVVAVQSVVLYLLAPWIVQVISHGRWDLGQRTDLIRWFGWILLGSALYLPGFLISSWISLRGSYRLLFFRVYLPWLLSSGVLYAAAVRWGGPEWAARANVPVALIFLMLIGRELRRVLIGSRR